MPTFDFKDIKADPGKFLTKTKSENDNVTVSQDAAAQLQECVALVKGLSYNRQGPTCKGFDDMSDDNKNRLIGRGRITPIEYNQELSELILENKERTEGDNKVRLLAFLETYVQFRHGFHVTEKNKRAFLKLMFLNNPRRNITAILTLKSGNVAMVTKPFIAV